MLPSGCSPATSSANPISFWTYPVLLTDAFERQTTTTSEARTAFRISASHSCPGTSCSSSSQGAVPLLWSFSASSLTRGLSLDEWHRKTDNGLVASVGPGRTSLRTESHPPWASLVRG